MEHALRLKPEDRAFCRLVARAAFANPFSDERERLDLEIAGVDPSAAPEERMGQVTGRVSRWIAKMNQGKPFAFTAVPEGDRELVKTVLLFDVFYRFAREFDELILKQAAAGPESQRVRFAAEALEALGRRGVGDEEASRSFAIFYQLRRAHFFIVRGLTGKSASMREFRKRLWQNVFTNEMQWYDRFLWNRMEDFSTLLLGETGAGKGAAAAAIGRSGFIPFDRKKECFKESFMRTFVSLNLSQFPESLIESELFGHTRGAFTGAVQAHQGVFERCSPHGAIFLDEIGDVSVPVQIKLLQVLQDRTFSPVGSHQHLRFSGRVIAATNQPLAALRERKLFRDDFFYRLCSDIITVPTLRQRIAEDPAELDLLLGAVLERLLGRAIPELAEEIRAILGKNAGPAYPWRGNVRELEQAVRRILLTREYRGEAEPAPALGDASAGFLKAVEAGVLDAGGLLAGYCARLHRECGSYEEVARRTRLDPRTVKKYLSQAPAQFPNTLLDLGS